MHIQEVHIQKSTSRKSTSSKCTSRKCTSRKSTSRKSTLLLVNLRFHQQRNSPLQDFRSPQRGWGGQSPCRKTSLHQQQGSKSFRTRGEAPLWPCLKGWCIKSSSALTRRSSDLLDLGQTFFRTPSLDSLREQTQSPQRSSFDHISFRDPSRVEEQEETLA